MTTFKSLCLLFNLNIGANSVDPDKTASYLDLRCLLMRLQNVSADNKNIRLFVICTLRVTVIHVRSVNIGSGLS